MDEQAITAGQIEKNGLGLAFPDKKAITSEALRAAILRLLEEPSFRKTARDFSEDMRSLGGAQATADAIVRFLEK
jgi:UDP:flavonoid glycosyltransferase YjiC (YdhE family)